MNIKKFYFPILLICILLISLFAADYFTSSFSNSNKALVIETSKEIPTRKEKEPQKEPEKKKGATPPLTNIEKRITKKHFGDFITPQTSPITPERFSGYHTGIDLEVFPSELKTVVAIKTICDGKLLVKRTASGYGGVAIQSCIIKNTPVTVIYGHLNLKSIRSSVGEDLKQGDFLGNLGKDKSVQTDGERKHLHLGIHKGDSINLLGYTQNKTGLSAWLDPCKYLCTK